MRARPRRGRRAPRSAALPGSRLTAPGSGLLTPRPRPPHPALRARLRLQPPHPRSAPASVSAASSPRLTDRRVGLLTPRSAPATGSRPPHAAELRRPGRPACCPGLSRPRVPVWPAVPWLRPPDGVASIPGAQAGIGPRCPPPAPEPHPPWAPRSAWTRHLLSTWRPDTTAQRAVNYPEDVLRFLLC